MRTYLKPNVIWEVLDDIREIKVDKTLTTLLKIENIPIANAISKYLRKHGIYSLHESHAYAVGKGKDHKKWEYGTKASLVTTKKK